MNAKSNKDQSRKESRSKLVEKIPLETPFLIQIFPVYACNFKCNYCIHSLEPSKRGFIADKKMMDYDFYKKCVDDILEFPQKIKMLRFAATGEPLLHPKISEMIEYATIKNVADSVEIVTNASLLTPKLTDKLVNSGLNWIRISIQALTSKKYKEITGIDIDFDQLLDNLKYLYSFKKNTKVYIKIIDLALNQDEKEEFYKIFEPISDKIAIEHLVPAVSDIDYSKISNSQFEFTQNGNKVYRNIEICPQPFYMMQINPDGNIVPCCSMETAYIAGNCTENSLINIWQGKLYKNFQYQQLKKEKNENKICAKCQSFKFAIFEEDILDNDAHKLIKLF